MTASAKDRPTAARPSGSTRLLPALAIAAFVITAIAVLASAGGTLGYDLNAYAHAGQRLLDGRPLYDPAVDIAGGFAIYLYPPPFALLILPFVPLTNAFGPWSWIAFLVGSFLVGAAILPVRREVRWAVILLGGLSWPLVYSLKLGQVGPILFLLFAIGWRFLDRPWPLGIAIAAGTIVKVQPAMLLGWALLSRRWQAALIGMAVVALGALLSTAITGLATWNDYLALLGRVSSPITTPHNFTPGAIAYQQGMSEQAALIVQWASTLAALGLAAYASLRASSEVGYLTAVTASQLISPLLWDHYAMLLLLPTAWLLEQRAWWAAAIPLATSIFFIWLPPWIYPIAFWAALALPLVVDWRRPAVEPVFG